MCGQALNDTSVLNDENNNAMLVHVKPVERDLGQPILFTWKGDQLIPIIEGHS